MGVFLSLIVVVAVYWGLTSQVESERPLNHNTHNIDQALPYNMQFMGNRKYLKEKPAVS